MNIEDFITGFLIGAMCTAFIYEAWVKVAWEREQRWAQEQRRRDRAIRQQRRDDPWGRSGSPTEPPPEL